MATVSLVLTFISLCLEFYYALFLYALKPVQKQNPLGRILTKMLQMLICKSIESTGRTALGGDDEVSGELS